MPLQQLRARPARGLQSAQCQLLMARLQLSGCMRAVLCCRLKLGAFINLDLCPILNGQPLQMMCKNVQVRRPHTARVRPPACCAAPDDWRPCWDSPVSCAGDGLQHANSLAHSASLGVLMCACLPARLCVCYAPLLCPTD